MMSRGKTLKTIQHAIEYAFVRTFYLLIRITPLSLRNSEARFFASLARLVTSRRVQVARHNLRLVFSESTSDEIDEVVRGVYRNLALNACDLADSKQTLKRIDVSTEAAKQLDRVRQILSSGRPVVFATGHFGNWEALGQYIGDLFTGCRFVAQEQSNKFVDRFLTRLRFPDTKVERIVHSGRAARELPRALKAGNPVFLVADQDAGSQGMVVDFLGTPASYHRGIASFCYHYNAPLVMLFLARSGNRLKLSIPAIIEPKTDAEREGEITRLLSNFSEGLGKVIIRYPAQWLWTHKRWKSTLGGY